MKKMREKSLYLAARVDYIFPKPPPKSVSSKVFMQSRACYALLTKREGKMAGSWPNFFFFFFFCETKSRSIKNAKKKDEANIQPS